MDSVKKYLENKGYEFCGEPEHKTLCDLLLLCDLLEAKGLRMQAPGTVYFKDDKGTTLATFTGGH